MLTAKLIHLAARLSLGREMANAMMLLQLIFEALQKKDVQNVAVFVFKKLPPQWRHPEGPATEAEFVDMIKTGEIFLKKVKAVVSH